MKKQIWILALLFISLNLFSCKETTPKKEIDSVEKQVENIKASTKQKAELKTDTTTIKKQPIARNRNEVYYVSANSGLNYRQSPKGKILGKFPLNTKLTVIDYPKIEDQIKDGNKIIKGEWYGVKKDLDTVYVFNAFLSSTYTYSDLKIYRASPYYIENGRNRTGFLNLSESFFTQEYHENEHNNIYEKPLLAKPIVKDTIRLNAKQRKDFLKRINILESDNIYIYDIHSGVISTFKVKNLLAIACRNPYYDSYNQKFAYETDYQIGLDLRKKFKGKWDNFAYVGTHNPFQKGKLKPILWSEIKSDSAIKKFKRITNSFPKFSPNSYSNFYEYNQDDLYYLLNLNRLIIIDKKEKRIVFEKTFQEGEGSSLTPTKMKNDSTKQAYQFTGKLFKNKPPIVFGFKYVSFGCESIDFISSTEPSIYLLCDNRH